MRTILALSGCVVVLNGCALMMGIGQGAYDDEARATCREEYRQMARRDCLFRVDENSRAREKARSDKSDKD